MNLSNLSIKETNKKLGDKELSCKELISFYIGRIESENIKMNVYLQTFFEKALFLAKAIDESIFQGRKINLLSGIPCAIKDNILIKGERASAGSKILEDYTAPYDATVVKKLKEKHSIILGKTNLDEFAIGSSGEHSAFGPTKNPLDHCLVPGGSSSGSAAAVGARMCSFALGSDTGGSVRQPASFCGVVGMKPTYGAISRYGLIAMASSLDQIGILTRSVEDAESVFDSIKGADKMDSTSFDFLSQSQEVDVSKMKIGVVKESLGEGIDKKVLEVFRKALENIEREGIICEEISLPNLEYGLACYYILMIAEVSSNLARYDGIKYGKTAKEAKNLLEAYFETRKQFLGNETKRRIMLGSYCLSAGYYDAYYSKAQQARIEIINDFDQVFKKTDLLLMPTSPTFPFKTGERMTNPVSMYLADLLTVPANLAGLPAISIPFKNKDIFPIGIQLVAPPKSEGKMFQFGKFFEKICQNSNQ